MGVKISELQEKTTANDTDIIPIVDTGTKKITKANLLKEATNSIETINTKLTNLGNYSTEEKVIGKWIDGKPLYRKVISCGALPNSTLKLVNHNISNIDNSRIYGFAVRTSDKREFPLPFSSSININENIQLDLTSTQIQIRTGVDRSSFNTSYIIVEYTKTTD